MASQLLTLSCGLAVVFATAACTNDVLDGDCTPDSPDITIDDDCPFAQAQGPQFPNPECKATMDGPSEVVSWSEAFAIMIDTTRGQCSLGGCHGVEETAANGIFLPKEQPQIFYDNLVATTGSVGRPYVDPKAPKKSWIHCNVAGTPGGGLIMPKPAGMPSKNDALKIENWVLSGANGP